MEKNKKENLQINIDRAKEIIAYSMQNPKDKYRFAFDKPYLHSNEGDFYKYLDMKGKDIITVGSSGDQVLYSKLYGAKNVTLFDLNPFAKYFYELKSAAIQTLPMTQTKQLLFLKSAKECDFNKTLEKLSSVMSNESCEFWRSLGEDFSHTQIINGLFEKYVSRYPSFMQNRHDYMALREVLKESPEINFIPSNLHDLPNFLSQDDKFDIALISNVLDYYKPEEYKEDIKGILPFINQNGLIQVNYSYKYPALKNHIKFPNKLEDVNELFGVNAINGKIYPHLHDVIPAPIRHEGSFAMPILRENSIFIKADEIRNSFEQTDEKILNIENKEDTVVEQEGSVDIQMTGEQIVDYFKTASLKQVEESQNGDNNFTTLQETNNFSTEIVTSVEPAAEMTME